MELVQLYWDEEKRYINIKIGKKVSPEPIGAPFMVLYSSDGCLKRNLEEALECEIVKLGLGKDVNAYVASSPFNLYSVLPSEIPIHTVHLDKNLANIVQLYKILKK